MDSTKPRVGGRPPTPWNSSRKRKLVRLFMLTTLTQVEIEDVLKAEGFHPSWSDIQKKLRALLPGDYHKEWRKYRPADTSNLRFEALRGGRKAPGRDAQQKTISSETSQENDSDTRSPESYFHLESFEGPLSAFRNYSGQDTTTPRPFGCVPLSTPTSQSQLVVPSRLLLDGSTVDGWWSALEPRREPMAISAPVTATSPCGNSGIIERSTRQVSSVSHHDSSSVISFHSLEQRISDRSSSIIRHVYSVLGYSMTSSLRSNSSRRTSWWSRERLENEGNSSASPLLGKEVAKRPQNRTNRKPPSKRKIFFWKEKTYDQNTQDRHFQNQGSYELSEEEQRIWNEMIDETQVVATSKFRPNQLQTSFMSLRRRCCCLCEGRNIYGTELCKICLSLPVHRLAGYPEGLPRIQLAWQHLLNKRDVFDHTPLHFAAASKCRMFDLISSLISLIKLGANMYAVNTSGDTFLHTLLSFVELDELQDCFPLFRFLATLDFPFCQRDYHGRTPLHIFLERCQTLKCQSFEVLEEMLDIMKPEIESMDNLGLTISYYFSTRSANISAQGRAAGLLSKYRTWHNIDINFKSKLDETAGNWQIWNVWVATAGRSTWVDVNGDTALIALIKYWTFDVDELLLVDLVKQLIKIGAQIHNRDRSGDTALAIASMCGFRLLVIALIEAGAAVRSENYYEVSILERARKALFQTPKSGNEKLYATILSCIVLLVDSGSKERLCKVRQSLDQHTASWVTPDQAIRMVELQTVQVLAESGFL